jgi:hypothetical protein
MILRTRPPSNSPSPMPLCDEILQSRSSEPMTETS